MGYQANITYPLKHLSIRVPWHDAGWNGTVCQSPKHNSACLKLVNIAESKDEAKEEAVAGKSFKELTPEQYPPCVKERASFMRDFALERYHEHPYHKSSPDTHAHFAPSLLYYPPYAEAGVPFLWMMKPNVFGDAQKGITGLVEQYPLDALDQSLEPKLPFNTHWVQDYRNHRTLFDCFWGHVKPEESLVFFYAKQVPLVEETGKRIIVGVGRVKHIGEMTEYSYNGSTEGKIRSLLWERMVSHSIRPDFKDGFILPYHEALKKSADGQHFDPAEVVAFAPEDRFTEFSYATEHVGNDAAINALLNCRAALIRASELFNYNIDRQEKWIDRELGRLWQKRGPFPGLGAILNATGIRMGHFIAQALDEKVGEEGDPWSAWDQVLQEPDKHLTPELARHIDATIAKSWQRMGEERRAFLQLLSRIDLSDAQAAFLAVPEERQAQGIHLADAEFLQNPYLVYEVTRLTQTPVGIATVDRGLFPSRLIRERFPIPEPTQIKTAVDARRLRSLCIRELEAAALNGDTLLGRDDIITRLRRHDEQSGEQRTEVTADLLAVAEAECFAGEIRCITFADGRTGYQLERLGRVGDKIRTTIEKRRGGKRHHINTGWRALLDSHLGPIAQGEDSVQEQRAREEKAAALAELANARFSVLIGPAGTGKTTLLSILCQQPEIAEGGILLLAPTGKARVRMEDVVRRAGVSNYSAYTLAQFLNNSGRYDGAVQRYLLTGEPGDKVARTVIVDECSMLTEEMMAALLEGISGVHRLIFVGDHRQLPPIGAGRPFADIIAYLAPDDIETRFPKVASAYAELTVPRRQGAGQRDDLQLAAWFGGTATAPGEDQVFEILSGARPSDTVRFINWETPDELEQQLPAALADALAFDPNDEEWQAFAKSLGAQLDARGSAWFNARWGEEKSEREVDADRWQILSPVRQKPWGVDPINRLLHQRYKGHQIEQARNPGKYRSIPKPMGSSQIIYGDKVINNRNWSVPKWRIYPKQDSYGYIANGEIGIVVGHRKTKKKNWKPENLEIEFSTQRGKIFKFTPADFDEEGEASLELAYALTVHKAQGSEFNTVFLILPHSPLMLSRELLYTALTRQTDKVVVLHQGSATDLQKLSSERYSATAARLTNLFRPPSPVEISGHFLEAGLIHITSRGEAVRSKSEVIIANLLHARGIDYHYEHPLELGGVTKYPDFTIEDDDAGITYYWEHCGMLQDPAYQKRWREKQAWYREHHILPLAEGGGDKGTLIVSEDDAQGGIDSAGINKIIEQIIG